VLWNVNADLAAETNRSNFALLLTLKDPLYRQAVFRLGWNRGVFTGNSLVVVAFDIVFEAGID